MKTSLISKVYVYSITKPFSSELRCVKHSARITSTKYKADLENLQCEQMMWQQTFNAMEGLTKLKQKDYVPFTTLNKSPYHCSSLSRSYKVSVSKAGLTNSRRCLGASRRLLPHSPSCLIILFVSPF